MVAVKKSQNVGKSVKIIITTILLASRKVPVCEARILTPHVTTAEVNKAIKNGMEFPPAEKSSLEKILKIHIWHFRELRGPHPRFSRKYKSNLTRSITELKGGHYQMPGE